MSNSFIGAMLLVELALTALIFCVRHEVKRDQKTLAHNIFLKLEARFSSQMEPYKDTAKQIDDILKSHEKGNDIITRVYELEKADQARKDSNKNISKEITDVQGRLTNLENNADPLGRMVALLNPRNEA